MPQRGQGSPFADARAPIMILPSSHSPSVETANAVSRRRQWGRLVQRGSGYAVGAVYANVGCQIHPGVSKGIMDHILLFRTLMTNGVMFYEEAI